MMDYIRQHPRAVTLIVVGFVALTIIAFGLNSLDQSGTNQPGKVTDPLQVNIFDSPLTQNSDSLTISYGGTSEPNQDSVQPHYRVFGLSDMPIPQAIKDILPDHLNQALWSTAIPTYASTYVQIDRSTLLCDSQYDCKFSFYLDSPESYYDFHLSATTNGTYSYTLQQQPLPGVSQ
jgi:hypothetical protein